MKTQFWFGLFVLMGSSAVAQEYDLLLKGGHLVDGKNRINAIRDVAIRDGKIAAVAASIDPAQARKVVNVAGLYVAPGLVDIHVHVYAGTGMRGAYSGDLSVYPDGFTFRRGVPRVVDAGSSGWRNLRDYKDRVIDRWRTGVLGLLNIGGKGRGGGAIEQDMNDMAAPATADQAKKYAGTVVGIKTAHFNG